MRLSIQYRAMSREERAEYHLAYYHAHKDKIRAQQKASYYRDHAKTLEVAKKKNVRRREAKRQWAQANKEKVNRFARERRIANPEKFRACARRTYHKYRAVYTRKSRERYYGNLEKSRTRARLWWHSDAGHKYQQEYGYEVYRRWYESKGKLGNTGRARLWRARNPNRWREITNIANRKYRRTENGKIISHNQNAIRRQAQRSGYLSLAEWREILEKQNFCCAYCTRRFDDVLAPTVDHVVPLSRGGQHARENIVAACQSCNSRKSNREVRSCG